MPLVLLNRLSNTSVSSGIQKIDKNSMMHWSDQCQLNCAHYYVCEVKNQKLEWPEVRFLKLFFLWTVKWTCVCVCTHTHDNHDSPSSNKSCLSKSCHLLVILCNCKCSSQLMAAIPERSRDIMRKHVKVHHLLQSLGKIKYLYLLYLVKISEAKCPCGNMWANSKVFPRSHENSVECQS